MRLATMADDRLAELGRRIDGLDASAHAGTQPASRVIRRRVIGLRKGEASARAAVHDAAASIEESVLALETKINLAEQAAAVDLAEDMDEFLGASVKELHSWGVYLERLQVRVATAAGHRRAQAELAIGELRRCRNIFGAGLGEAAQSTSRDAWREVRGQVQVARDELESRAALVEATLAEGSEG
jgi:hypothetical protein